MISNLVEVYCLAANLTSAIDNKLQKKKVGRKGNLNRAEYITLAIIKQEYPFLSKYSNYLQKDSV